jgi:high-affinity iron transporter
MITKKIVAFIIILSSFSTFGSNKQNELAVHLLSYLAQDYGEAVQDGVIVSEEEYQEQIDFISEVVRISETNNYDKALKDSIASLNSKILMKDRVLVVSEAATRLKSAILKKYNLLTFPSKTIDLVKANKLYMNNCMSCHGETGRGDGISGKGLEPAPTNFHDLERMHNVSPYGAFNTISLGVNGTGMASHDYISEEDRWSLAYYISAFRFGNIEEIKSLNLNIKESSALSDNEIKEIYSIDEEEFLGVLSSVRNTKASPPSAGGEGQLEIHLNKAIKDLKNSFNLYKSGQIDDAKNLSLIAYLKGIEPVEGVLRSQDSEIVNKIEGELSKYRHLLNEKDSVNEIENVLNPILLQLEKFKNQASSDKVNSSSFLMSFGIVLREAFEAGLILFLLLGITRKARASKFNKKIHLGWISSLTLGILLFVILELFFEVSGELAESIEGYTAIIASVMLFYVGYWLHKNTDVKKIQDTLSSALNTSVSSGKGNALFLISFASCFREVFETILFLKIIIIDGHNVFYVGLGAIIAIGLTMGIISFAIKYSIKLNLKYLFKASTVLIVGLSIIFLGRGIGALQKTGVLDQTRIDILSLPSIGFNSTLEVLIAQILVISFIFIVVCFETFNKTKLLKEGIE